MTDDKITVKIRKKNQAQIAVFYGFSQGAKEPHLSSKKR
jgi:hypothetical protein